MKNETYVSEFHGRNRERGGFKCFGAVSHRSQVKDNKCPAEYTWSRANMGSVPDRQLRILEKEQIACRDVRSVLGDYADGDLMPSLKGRIDSHIEECCKCRKLRHEYLATIELARSLKPKPMTSDVQNRLRDALNKRLGLQLNPVQAD